MLRTEDSHGDEQIIKRTRHRTSTSCMECKRRKQKCNKPRDRPCNNCARRYPPVECVYAEASKQREILGELVELDDEIVGSEEGITTNALCPSALRTGKGKTALNGSPRDVIHDEEAYNPDISHLFRTDPRGDYYRSPENFQISGDIVEPLRSLPLEPSRRNAELLYFFLQRLSPYMSTIDGGEPHKRFNSQFMPFMIQSPMVINTAILTTAYFQASSRKIDVETSVDAVTTRMKLITLINEHITTNKNGISDEAIAAVMSLAYNELVYADKRSTLAHMRGLRDMIRCRGGFENMSQLDLRLMLMRTDYQVACTFECDPIAHRLNELVPILESYPLELDSPLLSSNNRFMNSVDILGLSKPIAAILDDMRFVTTSLLSLKGGLDPKQPKFMATVQWIHDRLNPDEIDSSLDSDFLYQSCRAAAIIYTTAILSRESLSVACTGPLLQRVWMLMWRVPLHRWKQIPGVFFWILLVINPFACTRPEGRFIKGMVASCTMAIGLENLDVVAMSLERFLAVQRWLRGTDSKISMVLENRHAISQAPEGGLPAWSLT